MSLDAEKAANARKIMKLLFISVSLISTIFILVDLISFLLISVLLSSTTMTRRRPLPSRAPRLPGTGADFSAKN
jgi:hypothetical protein